MVNILVGIFIVLHGLVHLLYFALSQKYFEIEPLLAWPEGSWLLSRFFDGSTTRLLATILYMTATVVFVLSGIALLFQFNWWRNILVLAAILSSVIIMLFWDGKFQQLPEKGFIGLGINLVLLAMLVLLPRLFVTQ